MTCGSSNPSSKSSEGTHDPNSTLADTNSKVVQAATPIRRDPYTTEWRTIQLLPSASVGEVQRGITKLCSAAGGDWLLPSQGQEKKPSFQRGAIGGPVPPGAVAGGAGAKLGAGGVGVKGGVAMGAWSGSDGDSSDGDSASVDPAMVAEALRAAREQQRSAGSRGPASVS